MMLGLRMWGFKGGEERDGFICIIVEFYWLWVFYEEI